MFAFLRILHIFAGVFWTGAALMIAGFIEPSVRAMGPDGGKFMQRFMGSGFPIVMTGAGFLTVVSGAYLLWASTGGFAPGWPSGAFDMLILLGSVAALGSMFLGLLVNAPTAKRMAAVSGQIATQGGPPSEAQQQELGALRGRLHRASQLSAVLLTVATLAMAAARSV